MKMKLLDDEIRRWLRAREIGCRPGLGHHNRISKQLNSSIVKVRSWNPMDTVKDTHHGGIFNFDFSKDGSVLVAACEKRSVLVFDPLNGNLVNSREKAHTDCVNCVKFLDSRVFATCSDDTSVCLWDVRYLKHKIRSLSGHSNWVKNVEYDSASSLLVTSGFDGSIFTWDINRYSESDEEYKQVFHTNGLMRTKLTQDGSKLVVATSTGYLMVVHDLDLDTLGEDLKDFKPSMYRLMQQTGSLIAQAFNYNHVFTRKKNRVEIISDFPSENEAEMIASLEVHPQGWCCVSRNTSTYETREWTCVHDIQSTGGIVLDSETADPCLDPTPSTSTQSSSTQAESRINHQPSTSSQAQSRNTDRSRTSSPAFVLSISINENSSSPPEITQQQRQMSPLLDVREADLPSSSDLLEIDAVSPLGSSSTMLDLSHRLSSQGSHESQSSSTVSVTAPSYPPLVDQTIEEESEEERTGSSLSPLLPSRLRPRRRNYRSYQSHGNSDEESTQPNIPSSSRVRRRGVVTQAQSIRHRLSGPLPGTSSPRPRSPHIHLPTRSPIPLGTGIRLGDSLTVFIQSERRGRPLFFFGQNKTPTGSQPTIHHPIPRLTHYIEELNVGRGFIKEVSFSNDGRLICSPFGFGVRLLSFDTDCSEMCDVVPTSPVKLYELTTNMSHTSAVVTTKFSPVHSLFVSGCLKGKVDFHQPLL